MHYTLTLSHLMKLLNKNNLSSLFVVILSLLFLYSGSYKIRNYNEFGITLYNSRLIPEITIGYLQILLPVIEIVVFILLNLKTTRLFTLKLSFFILSLYTIYLIALNNFSLFDGCSCGGIFVDLDYKEHILINFIFVFINGLLLFFEKKSFKDLLDDKKPTIK